VHKLRTKRVLTRKAVCYEKAHSFRGNIWVGYGQNSAEEGQMSSPQYHKAAHKKK